LQQILYRITEWEGQRDDATRDDTKIADDAGVRVIKPAHARWKAGRARERDRLVDRDRPFIPLRDRIGSARRYGMLPAGVGNEDGYRASCEPVIQVAD